MDSSPHEAHHHHYRLLRVRLHRRNAKRLGAVFWINAIMGIGWLVMMPLVLTTGLKSSVPFLAEISLWALVVGHMASALAALAGKTSNENAATLRAPDEPPGP